MNYKTLIKKNLKYIGTLLTLVSMYYISLIFLNERRVIIDSFSNMNALLTLLAGIFLYQITQLNAVFSWFLQLHDKYRSIPFNKYYEIIGLSQIGKYLPGNFGHIVGRSFLASSTSIRLKDVSFSILFETILLIYSGLIISIGYIFISNLEIINSSKSYFFILLIGVTVLLFLYFYKFSQKFNFTVSLKTTIKIIALNCSSFIILGLILYVLQLYLLDSNIPLFELVSSIAVAFIAGFIMPGSPAGIGVREYVFIELLTSNIAKSDALVLIVGLRIINLIGDVLMYIIAMYLKNRTKKHYG